MIDPRTPNPAARWRTATLAVALLAPLAWALLSPPGRNDVVGGDEGYYGTMARNLLADPRQWLGPSLSPLGGPGDKPPLYPALLAVSIGLFGPGAAALRIPSFALAALVLLGTGALARRLTGSGPAGFAGTLLLASLPWFADASRVAAAELLVAALGVGALLVAERSPLSGRRAFAGGVLIGLAFLAKLWLASVFGLAVLFRLWPFRRAGMVVAAAAGFALAGGAQLAAVALVAPGQLAYWRDVVLGFSLGARAGGAGFAEYWLQPPHYYVVLLGRAFVLQLPLVLAGALWMSRRLDRPGPRMLAGWALGLALLSAFRVKAGGYAYPIVPAFAVLAALGAFAIAGRARALAIALVVLAAAGGFAREARRLPAPYHAAGYRSIARWLEPRLADVPPARRVLLAPEAPAFGYLLFRTAGYWGTPYAPWTAARRDSLAGDSALRAFVVDPSRSRYGGWPDDSTMAWLEAHAREVTREIGDTGSPPLRVFVRP